MSNVAAALGGLEAGEFDAQLLKAAWKDARATMERAAEALCAGLGRGGGVRTRSVWVAGLLGWIGVRYRYAPGEVTGREVKALLCGEEQRGAGLPKATRAARSLVAKAGATMGSFREAAAFLEEACRIDVSRETARAITLEAGRRTRESEAPGGAARPGARPPAGARRVADTLAVAPDGTCFPTRREDTAGRRGRDGGQAKGRNANVVCAGRYSHVGRDGRPVFQGGLRYHATGSGGVAFGEETWRFAEREGAAEARRVVFLSDGEAELEGIFQEHFAALPNVVRVLDAMHACQYVDALAKALEPDAEKAAKASRSLRKRLVNAGWDGFLASFRRRFGGDAHLRLGGDPEKAWNYLWQRRGQMDYARWRRRGIPIGSGMAEAACKLIVGARLKGPGMHWRFDNGIRVAAIRAALRSNRPLVA